MEFNNQNTNRLKVFTSGLKVPIYASSIFVRSNEAVGYFLNALAKPVVKLIDHGEYKEIHSIFFSDRYNAVCWVFDQLKLAIAQGIGSDDFYTPTEVNSSIALGLYQFTKVEAARYLGKTIDDSRPHGPIPYDTKLQDFLNAKLATEMTYFASSYFHHSNNAGISSIDPVEYYPKGLNEMPFKIEDTKSDLVKQNTENLLHSAVQYKEWTIPPNATIDLNTKTWRYVELHEAKGKVLFIFRDGFNYFTLVFDSIKEVWEDDNVNLSAQFSEEEQQVHLHAVKYIAAMILHDFWVTEYKIRNKTWNPQKVKFSMNIPWSRREADGRCLVYMPRLRYIENVDSSKSNSVLSLKSHLFTKRQVPRSAHVRNLTNLKNRNPNPSQVLLAQQYNVKVPVGYTFIRPSTEVNKLKDEAAEINKVYRSRSAFQSLIYLQEIQVESKINVKWHKFEEDVKKLIDNVLGYTILPRCLRGSGDGGIDAIGVKKEQGKYVYLFAQCKCWSRDRKVGVSIVREFVASIQNSTEVQDNSKIEKRGMIFTTSAFTQSEEMLKLTGDHNIELVDGDKLRSLVKS